MLCTQCTCTQKSFLSMQINGRTKNLEGCFENDFSKVYAIEFSPAFSGTKVLHLTVLTLNTNVQEILCESKSIFDYSFNID